MTVATARGDRPAAARRPGGGWYRDGALWLLLAGLVVQVLPWWVLPEVLTQDGPAHVDAAWVLLHHGDAGPVGAALREHYQLDLRPVPNMAATFLLAGLMTVLSPDVAEKVLVTGMAVLLVAGLRYALGGVDPRARWLAVAALPLAGSQLVVFGFYNFCLGCGLALVVLGLALRQREGWTGRGAAALSALLLLTWTAHLLPWLVAAAGTLALALGRALAGRRGGRRQWTAHLVPPVLALAPSAALALVYALTDRAPAGAPGGRPTVERLERLLTLYRPLVASSAAERPPAWVVAGCLALLLALAVRPVRAAGGRPGPDGAGLPAVPGRVERRVLGVLTVLLTAVYLVSPERLGDDYGFLPDRLAWFPPLLLVLFVATRPPSSRRVRAGVAAAVVVAACAAVLVRLPTQVRDADLAADLLSAADQVPPGSTFVVLRFDRYRAVVDSLNRGPNPRQHLSSRLAIRARAVDVGLYEAVTPYFQVRARPGADVRRLIDPDLDGAERVPPRVDLAAAGDQLQFVVVEGLDGADRDIRDAQRTARVQAALDARYEEVSRSRPGHDISVWRLRGGGGG